MLSLCTIDVEQSEPGTEVTVIWGNPDEPQKEIRATVAPAPYKKDNRRIDVSKIYTICRFNEHFLLLVTQLNLKATSYWPD
jgi:hypothetical protein